MNHATPHDTGPRSLPPGVLASAVESTIGSLIITDNLSPDNPIVYANQAFLQLCGYDEREVIGQNCRFLQGSTTKKTTVAKLRQAVDNATSVRVTLENFKKDGTPFWNDLVISPIQDENGNTTHFVGMQLDISDQINYTTNLERTQVKLQRANQELEQFTYAASHDLQEPLRMVSSYLQLLDKRYGSTFDSDAATFTGFALEGAERMQSLINDLLALSRVSSMGKGFKTVDFSEVMTRATFNLKLLIDETEATIDVGSMPKLPADGTQMVQLIQNLVGNALKYRRHTVAPIVRISATQHGTNAVFSISDNGIGIDKQYHQRIFVIFQRLHTREEYPGTGVGLAICSKIIDRHGGTLWVESNPDGGSTFKFSIPTKRKASR